MRIALIGYGKMGKTIEQIVARQDGLNIGLIAKTYNDLQSNIELLKQCDVAIEFTEPAAAIKNIKFCFENNIPVVVGTTGWYDSFTQIKALCESENGALFYATNFSIGVNLFFTLNKHLAKLMNGQPYDLLVEEVHHVEKKDAPSGTAITLAEGIIENTSIKENWVNNKTNDENDLGIVSKRVPEVPGTHSIFYTSEEDEIEIKHTAKGRTGFAKGAIKAAQFLHNKKGIYTMQDLLNLTSA